MSTTVTSHLRPGVYSVYEASSVVGRSPRRGWAGVVGLSEGGTPGKVYPLGTQAEAAQAFGKEDNLTQLVQVCMANGAARVLAVPVEDSSGYAAAFALLAQEENLKVVVCDSETLTVQQALRDHAASAAQDRKERIAVVPGGAGETVTQLTTRAASLNSERVVLVAPGETAQDGGARVAAALAGAWIATNLDVAVLRKPFGVYLLLSGVSLLWPGKGKKA